MSLPERFPPDCSRKTRNFRYETSVQSRQVVAVSSMQGRPGVQCYQTRGGAGRGQAGGGCSKEGGARTNTREEPRPLRCWTG
jgi:hypothetical protein